MLPALHVYMSISVYPSSLGLRPPPYVNGRLVFDYIWSKSMMAHIYILTMKFVYIVQV